MSRYKVAGPWSTRATRYEPFIVEAAPLLDTRTGRTYDDGAYRVVVDGKPALRGKGGTVPFYGETAWNYADNLARDLLTTEQRYVRST